MASTPTSSTHVDIASVINLEKAYLEQSPLLNGNGDVAQSSQQAVYLNGMLNNLSQSLNNNTTPYILSFQGDVKQIVNTETDRLMLKKQSIDTALTTQKRMIDINDSYAKRQREYTKIVTAIAVGLAVTLVIALLVRAFPFPGADRMSVIAIGVIIFVVFVYVFQKYRDISRRDPIYYDQLDFIPVTSEGANLPDISGNNLSIKDLAAGMGLMCVGGNCCSTYMKWDASSNLCVADATNGGAKSATAPATATTVAPAKTVEKFSVANLVKPATEDHRAFEPSEYDQYARVIRVTQV